MVTVTLDPAGVDDHLAISAALAAAGAGDTVALSAGTFACTADIAVPAGRSLVGTTGAIIEYSGAAFHYIDVAGTATIAGLDLRGPVTLRILGGGGDVARCTSRQAIYGTAAFMVYATSTTIAGVTFTDCAAIDTSGFGFYMSGGGTAPRIEDVTFRRCSATNCGAAYDNENTTTRIWVTGFDFCESAAVAIARIVAEDCTATNCYESGFHCEFAPSVTDCRISRCTSTNNGTIKSPPWFGGGFVLPPSWLIEDCVATGNGKTGFLIENNAANPHAGEPATLRRCSVTGPSPYGYQVVGEDGMPITTLIMEQCAVEGITAPNDAIHLSNVTGARITDLRMIDCTGDIAEYRGAADNVVTYHLAPFTVETAAPVTGETVAFVDHSAGPAAWSWGFGNVRLQGSPVSRKAWTIDALADDHAEIEALAALTGQHLTLNSNGVEYPGVMIRPPMLETQLTPAAWAYQVGFVQETRR